MLRVSGKESSAAETFQRRRCSPPSRCCGPRKGRPGVVSGSISSGPGEHLPQLRGESVRVTSLAVFAAQKTAVVAREDHRFDAESLRYGIGSAACHLTH